MPTKTAKSAKRPARTSSGGSSRAASSKGRTASSKGRATSSRGRGTPAEPALDAERIREIWGIGLIVVAILSGLGLWVQDSAGLVGVVLVNAFRGLFGVVGLVIPVLIAAGAVLLLMESRPRNPRIVGGSALVLAAVMGLWHLAAGAPDFASGREALHDASGWIGVVIAVPLTTVAALPGAIVVLMGLLVVGLLVLTATPLRVAAHAVVTTFVTDEPRPRRRRRSADEGFEGQPEADYVEDFADERRADLDGDRILDPATALDIPLDAEEDDRTRVDPARSDTVVLDRSGEGRTAEDDAERADLAGDPAAPDAPEIVATHAIERGTARKLVQNPDVTYSLPSLDLLRSGRALGGNTQSMEQMTAALERMLEEFGVDARVVAVRRGPTVTRFEIELGTGVKVNAITKLEKDIAYTLATPEIRIVAPIPGKVAIGIEVPNTERDHITLGDILRSPEAAAQTHPLTAGVGVDISGRPVTVNLAKMPHLLIAGATGSGKSVVMNSIVTSIIMRNTPDDVRMILIDPKRVEMMTYEDVPHLLTRVVTDPKRAKDALDWVVAEMERRYDVLARYGFRNLDRFNEAVAAGELVDHQGGVLDADPEESAAEAVAGVMGEEGPAGEEPLPYILCVIDELADLMMVAPRDIEGAIVRIAQMARAVGIHLIIATQRPSVNVVTGLIKANVPSRIALSMATGHDSKTILDQHGAEKLVGMGDMLYMPANASKPHRLQGCYIDEVEIEKIVDHCKAQAEVTYAENVVKEGQEAVLADVQGDDASDEDLTRAAMELVVRSGLGSTSMLQRKLKVGFARAGRLMDELEEMGVVGPSEGPKARTVLMTVDQLEAQAGSST
ncbi:DNA translocase FtsK [Euzebya sp.]|uniref:FtsK/SpoIIIE family DNA translocase n=1 Tax=Euzebya sp. TaxID=1971409 RepID=UPI0035119F20